MSDRTTSHRFRCPECGNRNESRLCVFSEDMADEPPQLRRMFCDVCNLTATAQEFVPHAFRRPYQPDETDAAADRVPDWSDYVHRD